jgi:hypothetical protein
VSLSQAKCVRTGPDLAMETILVRSHVNSSTCADYRPKTNSGICPHDQADLGLSMNETEINAGIKGTIRRKTKFDYAYVEAIKFGLLGWRINHLVSDLIEVRSTIWTGRRVVSPTIAWRYVIGVSHICRSPGLY